MATLSDVNDYLSYNDTLGNLAVWESNKVLLNAYASFTVSFYSSVSDITLLISFSNDGTNFDVNITKNFTSATKDYYSSVVYGKFCRIKLTNLGGVSDVRLNTYVNVQNTSLSAVISKVGNISPEVSVDNLPTSLYSEMLTSELTPIIQYTFSRLVNGNIYPKTYILPYEGINSYSSSSNGTVLKNDGTLRFGQQMLGNDSAILWGDKFDYRAGQGYMSRFSFNFLQTPKGVNDPPLDQYIGLGNMDSTAIFNFVGFGFSSTFGVWNTDDYDLWGIILVSSYSGTTFLHHSSFNVDKCDGSYILPVIDVSKIQMAQIRLSYGFGIIEFSLLNPSTGKYQVVHRINRTNLYQEQTVFSDTSLGLILYQNYSVTSAGPYDDCIRMGSFGIYLEGEKKQPSNLLAINTIGGATTSVTPPFNTILGLYNPLTWSVYSIPNNTPVYLKTISISVDGTKNCTIYVFRNPTFTGGAWSSPSGNYSPIQQKTSGTFTGGTLLAVYEIDKVGHNTKELLDIQINPDEYIGIAATSTAVSSVFLSVQHYIY